MVQEDTSTAVAVEEQEASDAVSTDFTEVPTGDFSESPSNDAVEIGEESAPESEEEEADPKVAAARRQIAVLEAELEALRQKKSGKIKSGSKPRANVTYTLLKKPTQLHKTPQVAQLQQIIFSDDLLTQFGVSSGTKEVKLTEPKLFEMIEAGAKSGMLRSTQPPVRVFQYYRSALLHSGNIRWE